MIITFAGKSNLPVQGPLKGFYVNCEESFQKIKKIIFGGPSPRKELSNDDSNQCLSFRWTLPLIQSNIPQLFFWKN